MLDVARDTCAPPLHMLPVIEAMLSVSITSQNWWSYRLQTFQEIMRTCFASGLLRSRPKQAEHLDTSLTPGRVTVRHQR